MDVNAIGMPTHRVVLDQSSTPQPEAAAVPGAKNYVGDTSDLGKVNNAKAELPNGVGGRVDKSA